MPDFDSFKDIKRVPHTEGNGLNPNANGILPNRLYPKTGTVDSWMEAVANANKRIQGKMDFIPGSIDDDSPELYKKGRVVIGKTFVAQKGSLDANAVAELRAPSDMGRPARSEARVAEPSPATTPVVAEDKVAERETPVVHFQVPPPTQQQPMPYTLGYAAPVYQPQPQVQYIERKVEVPVEKVVEKIVEKPIDGPYESWIKQRKRVQIATPDMTFTVSAVSVSRSVHGITVFLPTKDDGMTFVPKPGTHIKLGYDGKVEPTIFTGVTFEIEELGVLGLCFLVDMPSDKK